MKHKNPKSIGICLVLTKIVIALIFIACIFAPWFVDIYEQGKLQMSGYVSRYTELLVLVYLSAAVIVSAMFALHRLLKNAVHGEIFVKNNIKMLKIISYCVYIEAVLCLIFSLIRPIFLVLFVAAMFFAFVASAFKDLFLQALKIREENDYTI